MTQPAKKLPHPPRPPAQPRKRGARTSGQTRFTARDGRDMCLRPIRPDDAEALQRAFAHLTPEQARMRTFHRLAELPIAVAAFLCTIDPLRAAAFVVTDCASNKILADARIQIDPATATAEFGIVVDPDWTGQGIARALMARLFKEARQRGLSELWGDVLANNTAMLELVDQLGFERRSRSDDAGVVRVWRATSGRPRKIRPAP